MLIFNVPPPNGPVPPPAAAVKRPLRQRKAENFPTWIVKPNASKAICISPCAIVHSAGTGTRPPPRSSIPSSQKPICWLLNYDSKKANYASQKTKDTAIQPQWRCPGDCLLRLRMELFECTKPAKKITTKEIQSLPNLDDNLRDPFWYFSSRDPSFGK